jgi:membrane carboxypeptidase/penicillin-binding protein
LQPNTLVPDAPVTLPPIPGVSTHYWTPKNYDGQSWGSITLRRALENSKNLVTARLLDGGIDKDPTKALDQICELALEAKIYPECIKNYPFVLGAQPLRMIDLAQFYAAIANEGQRVIPYSIESIDQHGHSVYKHQAPAPLVLADGDRAAFYQLRTLLEGVVARGTAASMRDLTHFVGGKTGTTENENDAWFVGFTSDITVAAWVGYDNARGKRTLGATQTGGKVALPIVRSIIEASWNLYGPKTPLPQPSAEAARRLKALPIDYNSGNRLAHAGPNAFTEYFRIDGQKRLRDTQYALAGRHIMARGEPRQGPSMAEERPMVMPPNVAPRMQMLPPERRPRNLREMLGL